MISGVIHHEERDIFQVLFDWYARFFHKEWYVHTDGHEVHTGIVHLE